MRGIDVCHPSTKTEPAIQNQDQRTGDIQFAEIQNDTVGKSQPALLWNAQQLGGHPHVIFLL